MEGKVSRSGKVQGINTEGGRQCTSPGRKVCHIRDEKSKGVSQNTVEIHTQETTPRDGTTKKIFATFKSVKGKGEILGKDSPKRINLKGEGK